MDANNNTRYGKSRWCQFIVEGGGITAAWSLRCDSTTNHREIKDAPDEDQQRDNLAMVTRISCA